MHRIEQLAEMSIARGCGFAGLAIFTFMVGYSSQIALALSIGGVMTLLATAVLWLKAWRAPNRPYRQTEVWIMLERAERPHKAIAQQIIGNVLRDVYVRFALRMAWLSAGLLVAAVIVSVLSPVRVR